MATKVCACLILVCLLTDYIKGEKPNSYGEGKSEEPLLDRLARDADDASFADKVKGTPNVEKNGDVYSLRIVTILNAPYTMFNDDGKYVGFLPDLIEEMFARADPHRRISYTFYTSPDGKYGSMNKDGTWNGMMGEVLKNTNGSTKEGAHLAASPLTITAARVKYADFLQPFAHNKLTFVIQKPHMTGKAPNMTYDDQTFTFNYSVFKPLQPAVWILVILLMVAVWLFTWLMNRFNPYEFGQRHQRNLASDEEAEYFNISGSLWYTFTILQWQGYDRAPRSLASKTLGCFWMVFVTITLVTYTGSLFNILFWASNQHGTDPLQSPIRDLRDLINHKDGYRYGFIKGGSTYRYITTVARGEEAQIMRNHILSAEGEKDLVRHYDAGLEKVRKEKYALLMESPMAEFHCSHHPCDLMKTGIDMGMSAYGLAMPKNAPYGEELHKMLMEMIETGELEGIKEKWFNDHQCWNVSTLEKAVSRVHSSLYMGSPQPVSINMFWSPLVVMVIGLVLASLVAVGEILWYKYRGRYDASNRDRGEKLTNEDGGSI